MEYYHPEGGIGWNIVFVLGSGFVLPRCQGITTPRVENVGIAVELLGVIHIGKHGVGLDETAERRTVVPSTVVVKTSTIFFLAGELEAVV